SLLWPEVIGEIMLLWDGRRGHHDIVTHAGLRSRLDHPPRDLQLKSLEPSIVSSLAFVPQLWSAVDKALPTALDSISKRRAAVAEERAGMLEATLRAELCYLRWRADTAETADEAQAERAAIAARNALIASVRQPRVELLGLALVALA